MSLESSESDRASRHQGETQTWLPRREPAEIPGQNCCRKCLSDRISITVATFYGGIICIAVLVIVVITLASVLSAQKPNLIFENHMYTACPETWIGFGSKCFYFSEDIRNWTFSESFCASLEANLVQIETQEELNFLIRYKGSFDHWIGFINESLNHNGEWTTQTRCDTSLVVEGPGECLFLNNDKVSLGRIYIERRWICSKPTKNICRCQTPLNPS